MRLAYKPINSWGPPSLGSRATLYDFVSQDSATKVGNATLGVFPNIGKWCMMYHYTGQGAGQFNDRTEGNRFKTATIAYASAANGSPADNGGGGLPPNIAPSKA